MSPVWNRAFRSNSITWIALGAVLSAALTVIGFRIIGEVVGARSFGAANLLYGICLLVSGSVAGPISQALTRLYFRHEPGELRDRLWSSGLALAAIGGPTALAFFVFISLAHVFSVELSIETSVALIFGLAFEMLSTLCRGWLNAQERFSLLGLSQVVQAALRPILVLLLIGCAGDLATLVIWSYAVSTGVVAIFLTYEIAKRQAFERPDEQSMAAILQYGHPLIGNSVFAWLAAAGDRYLVAASVSVEAAGIYIAATAIGGRFSLMLGDVIETYLRPRVYEAVSASDFAKLRRVCVTWALWILTLGCVMLALLLFGMPAIVLLLLAPEFREGSDVVIIASYVASWIVALGYIPQRLIYAFDRTWLVTWVEVGSVGANAVVVFGLALMYGLSGAAIGLVLSAMLRLAFASVLAASAARRSASERARAVPEGEAHDRLQQI